MTDKDPKDMTASELVRWVENYTDIMCRACREMGFGCEDAEVSDCEKALEFIADKIDAELAQARKDAIRESKKPMWWFRNAIKCGYDWPEPRDGEKFRDYLHRCFLPRPRFEDGEPVQFGEEVELHYKSGGCDKGRFQEIKYNKGSVWILSFTGVDHAREYRYDSERDTIKRPAPEALGADGKPIVEGETVWLDEAHSRCAGSCGFEDGNKYSLCGIERQEMLTVEDAHIEIDGREYVRVCTCGAWCHASWLTHTPPETQERIDRDVHKDECEYFDHVGNCRGCPANATGESCIEAMTRDLLRRQRELDKWTGGE